MALNSVVLTAIVLILSVCLWRTWRNLRHEQVLRHRAEGGAKALAILHKGSTDSIQKYAQKILQAEQDYQAARESARLQFEKEIDELKGWVGKHLQQ